MRRTSRNDTVRRFGRTGNLLATISGNMNVPMGLAIDAAGNLLVANRFGASISKFSPAGTFLSSISSNVSFPQGLAIDASGNIYSTNNTNSVSKFDSAGVFQATISGSMNNPYGLAFDTAGNLYVGNGTAGTILKFDSSGSFVFSWNSVQSNFLLVAPSAVPEPSALLLAFCGLMGAGFAMRRPGRALAAGSLRN